MSGKRVDLFFHHIAHHDENVTVRHQDVAERMQKIDPPLGWRGLKIPPAPDFGKELLASFSVKYPTPGLRMYSDYSYRDASYLSRNEAALDDKMSVSFPIGSKEVSYRVTLYEQFPLIIEAYRGYRATLYYGSYFLDYEDQHEDDFEKLKKVKGIEPNGRNNIFTLHPAQYWDAELCQQALGYSPDEVIRRLEGKVPLVKPLMDGVYTVFNDDPNLTFDEFCAINDRFKPILGLV